MKRRIFGIFCALCLCLALLPVPAGAVTAGPDWTYGGNNTIYDTIGQNLCLKIVFSEEDNLMIEGVHPYSSPPNILDLSGTIRGSNGRTYIIDTILERAFEGCRDFESIDLPEGLTSIRERAFADCTDLESIGLPADLTSIGNYAFNGCAGLTSIDLPEDLTSIGIYTFKNCTGLESIALPAGLASIRGSAFNYCTEMTEIMVEEDNLNYYSLDGVLFTKDMTELIRYPEGKEGDTYQVPATVTSIGDYAFYGCAGLESIDLPEDLTSIGYSAFEDCTGLESIDLPEDLTSIEMYAFQNCTGLKTLTLLSKDPPELGEDALEGCSGDLAILVPPGSVEKYQKAEGWRDYADQIEADQTPVTGVTVTPETLDLTVGGTATLTAAAAPDDASNKTVTWSTSDSGVATVTADGSDSGKATVTAVGRGTATITATTEDGGKTATCTVTVTAPEDNSEPNYSVSLPGRVEGGEITVKKSYAEEGETFSFTATPDEGYELDELAVLDGRGRELDLTYEGGGAYSFEMPAGGAELRVSFRKIAVEPEKLPFTDVPAGAWYADGVGYVYENGLMAGISDTLFGPDTTTSRSMVATILWRMAGSPVVDYALTYTDVPQGRWYTEAIRWAASQGIVSGYGDTFGADDPITREQLAVMLYRMAQKEGQGFTGAWAFRLDYADAGQVSDYAYEALCWTTMHGIITGTDGGLLSPQGPATRAQAAVMLKQFGETCGF